MASKKNAFTVEAPETLEPVEPANEVEVVETETESEVDANPEPTLIVATNVTSFAEAEEITRQLGADAADGIDAQPKMGMNVADWAASNVVDPNPPKKADIDAGRAKITDDHVRKIFTVYANAEGKAMNKRTAKSIKSQLSKLRAFAKLGARDDINAGDFLLRAQKARNKLVAEGKPVKAPYEALVQACRDVNGGSADDQKPDLNSDEMNKAVGAKAKSPDSAESIWLNIDKQVKKLFELKLDTGDTAKQVRALVQTKKEELSKVMKFERLHKEALELGLSVSPIRGNIDELHTEVEEITE